MCKQKVVLLKITGEFFHGGGVNAIDVRHIRDVANQIKALQATHYFGIVVGGGNFFRGTREGASIGMDANASDYVGMLATLMNGVILQNIFAQEGVDAQLFSALECPSVATALSPQELSFALRTRDCIIFAGGMGNPFFTTDTTAVVRAIQMGSEEVWKATKVDGVYTNDPNVYPAAQIIQNMSFDDALSRKIRIMDESALTLARDHGLSLRVFSLFTPNALVRASCEARFGSTITP